MFEVPFIACADRSYRVAVHGSGAEVYDTGPRPARGLVASVRLTDEPSDPRTEYPVVLRVGAES